MNYLADELDQELNLRVKLLTEIAAGIVLDEQTQPAELQQLLDQRDPSITMFPQGVLVVNREGAVIVDHAPVHVVRYTGQLGDPEYFREIILHDRPIIGRPIIASRFLNRPNIPIGVPLRDKYGRVTGALVAPVISSDADLFGKLKQAKLGSTPLGLVLGFIGLARPVYRWMVERRLAGVSG